MAYRPIGGNVGYPRIYGLFSVTAILSGCLVAGSAFAADATPTYVGMTAQDVGVLDQARPAYDAKGIPMGGFRLFPSLGLDATYDDNVFRLPAAQSDYFFTIAPTLRLESQWGRHFLEFYAGLDDYDYASFTREDLMDWKVGSDGRLDISRAANLTANFSYGELHEALSSPNTVGFQASPNRDYLTHGDLVGTYQPNRLGVALGASVDRFDWSNTPLVGGGTLDNADRNETEYQSYAKVFYEFSPEFSAFFKSSYDDRTFDQELDRSGTDRSAHAWRFDGGADLQLTHLVRGEVYIGYLHQEYAQAGTAPLRGIAGLDYAVQLDWFVSPLLTVHLNGSRQLSDVVIAGASAADNKSAVLSADYEFRPNIILQAHASYMESDYPGTTRIDHLPEFGAGSKYLLNNYASVNLSFAVSERNTNVPGVNYSDNTVNLSLNLQI